MAIISLIDFSFNVRNKKDNGTLLLNVFDVTLLFQKDRFLHNFLESYCRKKTGILLPIFIPLIIFTFSSQQINFIPASINN